MDGARGGVTATAAGLNFAGAPLEVVSSFRNLGIVFEAARPPAGSAGPARTGAARAALGPGGLPFLVRGAWSCGDECAAAAVQ